MVVGTRNGGYYIDAGEITLAINDDGNTNAYINANKIFLDGSTKLSDFFSSSGGAMTFDAGRIATDYISVNGSGGPSSFYGTSVSWKGPYTVQDINGNNITLYFLGGNAPS